MIAYHHMRVIVVYRGSREGIKLRNVKRAMRNALVIVKLYVRKSNLIK
jgi:hypothetical protein